MTRLASSLHAAALPLAFVASLAAAQPATSPAAAPPSPTPSPTPAAPAADPLAEFAWLDGCWKGSVNQRDFREHWMAPQGGMLLGVSQVVMAGKTVGYEYLKIETRPDGVYYVAVPSDSK
ncbi:MAG TPA: DUF6265 family protein, partial [Casimicrobiaceae bacterium]|nr:DUF6265 family protein [Casimicrobiaceae bacterium]